MKCCVCALCTVCTVYVYCMCTVCTVCTVCTLYDVLCICVSRGVGTAEAGCGVRGELCVLCAVYLCVCMLRTVYRVLCGCVFWFVLVCLFLYKSALRVPVYRRVCKLSDSALAPVCALLSHDAYHQHNYTFYAHTHTPRTDSPAPHNPAAHRAATSPRRCRSSSSGATTST